MKEFLMHHGVKGMKWGIRKQEVSNRDKSVEARERKREARKMARRLNDESTFISLTTVYDERAKGSKHEKKLLEQNQKDRNKAFKEVDAILSECKAKGYSVSYIETTTEWTNGVDYITNLPVIRFDVVDERR